MAEPKLLVPLRNEADRSSGVSKGAQAVLGYTSKRDAQKKSGSSGSANTNYKPSYSAQRVNDVDTPELDRATGNDPEFITTKTEDFVAPSSKSEKKLTNEEQALEIMGLLNPVDFSPEAVAEREWEKAGVKNAEEYRKALPGIVQKDVNDLRYFFEEGALLAAESGLTNTVSALADAGRAINDFVTKPTPLTEALSAGYAPYVDKSKDVSKKVGNYLLGFADEQAQSSQDAMAIAKSNVNGTVGEVLLDATAAGSQMVGDIIIGAATGGSSKIPMAIRSFGSGVQEARNKGYTLEQQMALGLSSAAIEYVTEKFFGGNPFYDKAEAGLINKFIAKVSNNKELLVFLSSTPVETLNEGLEEILSGVLNPLAEKIIAGESDPVVLEDLLKEGLIGVMLGGAGQVAKGIYNKQNTTDSPLVVQEQEQAADTENPMTAEELVEILLGNTQQNTPVGGAVADDLSDVMRGEKLFPDAVRPVSAGRATTIKNPYTGTVPTQTFTRQPPTEISAEQLQLAATTYQQAEAQSQREGSNFKTVLSKLYAHFKGPKGIVVDGMSFEGSEYKVNVSNGLPGKLVSQGSDVNTFAVLDSLEDIIRTGEYVGSGNAQTESGRGKKSITRYDYFESDVVIAGQPYIVRWDAEIVPGNNKYKTHRVVNMQIDPVAEAGRTGSIGQDPSTTGPMGSAVEAGRTGSIGQDPSTTGLIGQQADTASVPNSNISQVGPVVNTPSGGMKRSQTESNSVQSIDAMVDAPQDVREPLYYEPATEAESLNAAMTRFTEDPVAAEEYLRSRDNWSNVDVDTASVILGSKAKEARASGDWTAYREWRKVVQEHGTEIGRSLQSFAKWSRTPGEAALDNATGFIEGLEISEDRKNAALARIAPFCDELDAVDNTDADAIKDLILRMNTERRTGTIIPGALEKLLDNQSADYLYKVAQAQLQGMAHDYAPHDVGNMVKSWQTIAQLLKVTTTSRNLLGNEGFGFIDALVGNTVGQAIDQAVSKETGIKAVPSNSRWFSSTYRKAAVDAMEKSILEIALDVDMGSVGTKYDPQSRAFRMNGNPAERFVSRLSQILSYSLNSTDKLSRGGIEAITQESLANKNTEALGSGKITADQLSEVGEQSADYQLFQNKGKAAGISKDAHDMLNYAVGVGGSIEGRRRKGGFGAGDVLMPYATVPANLGVKPFEMSPIGIMTGGYKLANVIKDAKAGKYNPAAQHQAIMEIARGMTGVPLAILFSSLAKAGIIKKSDDEDEYDVTNARKAEGRSDTQWNLDATMRWITGEGTEWQEGDTLVSLNWLQPINAFMEIGAMFNELSEDGDATLWDYAGAYANGTIKAFLDMPVVTALQDAVSAVQYADTDSLGEKVGEFAGSAAKSFITGMMPGIVSNTGKAMDGYQRDTSGDTYGEELANAIIANIPVARQSLPVKQDAFGNDMDTGNPLFNALNNMVLPGAVTEYTPNDVVQMLDKVYAESGTNTFYPDYKAPSNFSYGGTKYELSADEQRAYKETFGQTYNEMAAKAVDNATFGSLTSKQQAEVLSDIRSYATAMAKDELITRRGEDYDNEYAAASKLSDPVGYFSAKTVFGNAITEDSRDYAAVDSLMGHYGSLAEDVREKLGDGTRMDDIYKASQAGIDSENWYKAYDEWKRISDTKRDGYSGVDKATDFSRWVDAAGFTKEQAKVIKSQLTFHSGFTAEPTKYNDLTGAGLSADVSDRIYDAVSSLKPVNFNSTVQAWQKYEAIANSGATVAEIEKALKVYMGDDNNDHIKYDLMKAGGYSAKDFAIAFHYRKTSPNKETFIKMVEAQGVKNASRLYKLLGSSMSKDDLAKWKW